MPSGSSAQGANIRGSCLLLQAVLLIGITAGLAVDAAGAQTCSLEDVSGSCVETPTVTAESEVEVALFFHVIYCDRPNCHELASDDVSDATLLAILDSLNAESVRTGVSFRLVGISRTETGEDDWVYWGGSGAGAAPRAALEVAPAEILNVYFAGFCEGSTPGTGSGGLAVFPWASGDVYALVDDDYLEVDATEHEIGHTLGLCHTSSATCSAEGDHVADTPPHLPYTNPPCDLSLDTCPIGDKGETPDPVGNIMYEGVTSCRHRFTEGQGERMRKMLAYYREDLIGPVILEDDVSLRAGTSWRLMPGSVLFASGQRLIVHGDLVADDVTFTEAAGGQGWDGITVAGGLTTITGGRVEHATTGVTIYDPARVVIGGTELAENGTGLDVRSNSDGTQPGAILDGAVVSGNTMGMRTDYVVCYETTCTCLSGCRGRLRVADSFIEGNSGIGIYALNGDAQVTGSCVQGNAGHGVTVANALVDPFTTTSLSENGAPGTITYGAAVLSGGDLQLSPATAPGGNRLTDNTSVQLYVGTGGAASAGYESTSGQNAFERSSGGPLIYASSGITVTARYNWWGASQPPAGAFPGPGSVDAKSYVGTDPTTDVCASSLGSGGVAFASPGGDSSNAGSPAGLETLRTEIRRLRRALEDAPEADSAAALVRTLYALQRIDRTDRLGEWAATMGLVAGLRARLNDVGLPLAFRATAEVALEMEAADALAREQYAEARELLDAYRERVESVDVRRALTLTYAFLEAHAGRRAEAAAMVAGVAREMEVEADARELEALAAILGEAASEHLQTRQLSTAATTTGRGGLGVAPNPSNGTASVTLTLGGPATVHLAVYDVLGRETALVHVGSLAGGVHALRLDVRALPAGPYVVRAQVEPEAGAPTNLVRRFTVVR